MKIELDSKPKPGAVIIDGFPGFGFVSTIAAEFLLDHLQVKPIGRLFSDELAPMAIVHGKRVIQPLEIFYDEKHNLIILEAVSGVHNLEWDIADALLLLYKKVGAKEIVSLEGVQAPPEMEESDAFFFSNHQEIRDKLLKTGLKPLKEGIVFGVSGALMMQAKPDVNASFLFGTAHSQMPDARAAAKLIEALDKYLGLAIPTDDLLKKADEFEAKLQGMMEQVKTATKEKGRKEYTPYIG